MNDRPIRIANCSGYSGDRREAIRELLAGDPVDVITGDYLAEVTIAGMAARRMQGRGEAYSEDLIAQLRDGTLDELLGRGIKLVVNAGGFDPGGLAERLRTDSATHPKVAHLEGDNLLPEIETLLRNGHPLTNLDTGANFSSWGRRPLSASAYLGAFGIKAALDAGADIVVCGRVTDASLIVGPAAWWHGWTPDDLDALAGAVVAGHIIECGPQATGGNFSGFTQIPDLTRPGFPIAELAADGSAVVTKQPGTGGSVTTDTVTAQLLYEIQGPIYLNPDVTVDLRPVTVTQHGPDRVEVTGATGTPPPATTKVAITAPAGWENSFNVYLCGLDIDAKAALVAAQAQDALHGSGVRLHRVEQIGTAATDPQSIEAATVTLRIVGRADTPDPLRPGAFFHRVHSTILSSIPGFHADGSTGRALRPSPVMEYWPALVDQAALRPVVVHDDGTRDPVPAVPTGELSVVPSEPGPAAEEPGPGTVRVPLGRLAHTRAGDKGGNSNVGIWTDERRWPWLRTALSEARFRQLFPEARDLRVDRHELPNLRAVHFVIHGNLGTGCTSNARLDALGKSVGEYLRARHIDVPEELL